MSSRNDSSHNRNNFKTNTSVSRYNDHSGYQENKRFSNSQGGFQKVKNAHNERRNYNNSSYSHRNSPYNSHRNSPYNSDRTSSPINYAK